VIIFMFHKKFSHRRPQEALC